MGRKSKAVVRKQEILEHFYTVMCAEGFENASIAKVAASMDVNPSLLIHYFKTKDEMVVELVDFFLNRYEAAFVEDFRKLEEPQARFDKAMNTLFGTAWLGVGNYSVFYACFYLASRNERIQERFQLMYDRFARLLVVEAEAWIQHKIVRQTSAQEITDYLIIMTEGMAFYQRLRPAETWESRAASIRRMVIQTLTGA